MDAHRAPPTTTSTPRWPLVPPASRLEGVLPAALQRDGGRDQQRVPDWCAAPVQRVELGGDALILADRERDDRAVRGPHVADG